LREKVYALTDKHGADVVIDPVGGDANAAALRALAWCGRLIIVGFASNQIPSFKANYLLLKNIAVIGIQWSDYRERTPERVSEAQRGIFELYQQGRLDPHIDATLPLEQFADALRALRDGKAHGKFILQVRPE
jgi:NADPH2:quinone reductase